MKKTRRHIGIDLHQNSFTACILQGDEEQIHTFPLQLGGLERFIEMLRSDDEIAGKPPATADGFANGCWSMYRVWCWLRRGGSM